MSHIFLVKDSAGSYLIHHGRPGQKWGERHGPPYPLSRQSESERKELKPGSKVLQGKEITNRRTLKKKAYEKAMKFRDKKISKLEKKRDRLRDYNKFKGKDDGKVLTTQDYNKDREYTKKVADLGLTALKNMGEIKDIKGARDWFLYEDQTVGLTTVADLVNKGKSKSEIKKMLKDASNASYEQYINDAKTFNLSEASNHPKIDEFIDSCIKVKKNDPSFNGPFNDTLNKAADKVTNGVNKIVDTASKAAKDIKSGKGNEVLDKAADKVTNGVNKVADKTGEVAKDLIGKVKNLKDTKFGGKDKETKKKDTKFNGLAFKDNQDFQKQLKDRNLSDDDMKEYSNNKDTILKSLTGRGEKDPELAKEYRKYMKENGKLLDGAVGAMIRTETFAEKKALEMLDKKNKSVDKTGEVAKDLIGKVKNLKDTKFGGKDKETKKKDTKFNGLAFKDSQDFQKQLKDRNLSDDDMKEYSNNKDAILKSLTGRGEKDPELAKEYKKYMKENGKLLDGAVGAMIRTETFAEKKALEMLDKKNKEVDKSGEIAKDLIDSVKNLKNTKSGGREEILNDMAAKGFKESGNSDRFGKEYSLKVKTDSGRKAEIHMYEDELDSFDKTIDYKKLANNILPKAQKMVIDEFSKGTYRTMLDNMGISQNEIKKAVKSLDNEDLFFFYGPKGGMGVDIDVGGLLGDHSVTIDFDPKTMTLDKYVQING